MAALNATLNATIVGAGPVGLALALRLLQTTDYSLTLFDAKLPEQAALDPRTLALSAGSQQLLHSLGAWQHLAAKATPISQIFVSQQSTPLASLHITAAEQGVAALGYTCRYGDLVAAMHAALAAADTARFITSFGHKITRLVSNPSHNSATLIDDRELEHTTELLSLAEGGLFAEQASKPIRRDYGQSALIADVNAAKPISGAAFERFTAEGALALLPTATGYSLVWCLPTALAAERQALSLEAISQLLSQRFGSAMGTLTVSGSVIGVPLGLNAERQLVDGRVVRLGNAAQTLHPVAGQGFNLGLRDAWALASAIAAASPSSPLDQRLAIYQRQRTLDRSAMIGGTDLFARAFTWSLPGANALRGAGLAALTLLPPARHALARWMMRGIR